MNKASLAFLSAAALGLAGSGHAALIMLPDPVAATASTEFPSGTTYAVDKLYDGTPTLADVGTTNNLAGQYAGNGVGPHYIVYNMGSSIGLSGVFYAQRMGGVEVADKVGQIDFWLQNSDPGTVLADPAGAADYSLSVTNVSNDGLLTAYDFGGVVGNGQFVVMKLTENPGSGFNPGGTELVLGTVPEPGSTVLLGLAGFALALRRRR
jgi:hypothetical protein